MIRKLSENLAKDYDFETKEEFYTYIVDTLINGNRSQVKELFNQMKPYSKKEFLNEFLTDDNSYHTSCRKICINELINA